MNLSQLYYFRKLAELQHYTRAAKELYITQPALSDAIKTLERELGVPLFRREGRNVRLTRYGREFSVYVNNALMELDKGIAVMKEYTGSLTGTIKIGGMYTINGDYLPMLISAYHKEYGDQITFEVTQDFSIPLIKGMAEERYDVAFAAFWHEDATLTYEPVASYQLVVATTKDSPLAQKKKVSLNDLHGYEVITYRKGTPIGEEVDKAVEPYNLDVRQVYDDEITLCGMLQARKDPRACSLMLYTIGVKPFSDLVFLPIDTDDIPLDFHQVYLIYRTKEFKTRAVESFIEFTLGFVPPEGAVPRLK